MLTHSKVADAGVVGLPDELAGELPVAFVVKKTEDVTEKELQDFVAGMYEYTSIVLSFQFFHIFVSSTVIS